MMLKDPQEFEHIAREWAVKYAGAPQKDDSSGSGGVTEEDLMKSAQEAKKPKESDQDAA